MKVTGERAFAVERNRVWDALRDPDILGRALPGVRRLERADNDEYAITIAVGLGSVKGIYDGGFQFIEGIPPESCTVRATATGRPGSVETVASVRLRDDSGSGTVLSYDAEASITGPLAGVGQRLIGAAAQRTTADFFEALERELVRPTGVAAPDPEPAAAAPPPGPPALPLAATRRGAVLVAGGAMIGGLLVLLGFAAGHRLARSAAGQPRLLRAARSR